MCVIMKMHSVSSLSLWRSRQIGGEGEDAYGQSPLPLGEG